MLAVRLANAAGATAAFVIFGATAAVMGASAWRDWRCGERDRFEQIHALLAAWPALIAAAEGGHEVGSDVPSSS